MANTNDAQERYHDLLTFLKEQGVPCAACAPCNCGNSCAQSLQPLNGDASFRRYYRLRLTHPCFVKLCAAHGITPKFGSAAQYLGSIIVVDAPPATQKNREFIAINRLLRHCGILVPTIICADPEHGFMVLEDLGRTMFADAFPGPRHLAYYFRALVELTKIGAMPRTAAEQSQLNELRTAAPDAQKVLLHHYELDAQDFAYYAQEVPPFDADFIAFELSIFTEWLLDKTLHLELSAAEQDMLTRTFAFLTQECLAQPQGAMHRDFHCRNLMVTPEKVDNPIQMALAVIDYQDMVKGPIGYDLASLLYDCYSVLPEDERQMLLSFAYESYCAAGRLDPQQVSLAALERMVRICALQRHIKVLGIFNRLYLRDGKSGYLKDLPLTLDYVLHNCDYFPEMADFKAFLQRHVVGKI